MVPAEVTQAVIAHEHDAVAAWAARHGWTVRLQAEAATLAATATHPAVDRTVRFHADLTGFPALPPAWDCRDENGAVTQAAYPAPGTTSGVAGSIFHTQPVICAPWNRLAYADHGGPHPDWAGPGNWKTANPTGTQAHTLADMLAALRLHLSASPGMQA